ncbi:MAG: rRNA adenine dimethyltransferase family protein, partial [bacterium]|nr:rRNA adenine dimethyltransferase family protein [bacterium]
MDLTNRTVIKDLFRKYGIRPEKYLGQHFILSKKALAQMVAAAEIKKNDTVVEIGPGLGTLTQELAQTGAKIIAIEKDPEMISILKETLADYKNIKIIQADARKFPELISEIKNFSDFGNLKSQYKIVANLPYNIATFLIRQW